MRFTRRHFAFIVATAGAYLIARPLVRRLRAQERVPNRPEFTLVGRNYRYSPDRIEVSQDDLVRVTVRSEDMAYSFAID